MRFNCTKCGRAISPNEGHALCKPCHPSNRRYEQSDRRRFRKFCFYYAKVYRRAPTFSEAKFEMWIQISAVAKLLKMLGGIPVSLSQKEDAFVEAKILPRLQPKRHTT